MNLIKPKIVKDIQYEKVEVVKVDTQYIPRDTIIYKTKVVPKLVYQDPDTIKELVMVGKKNYMDTIYVDSTMQLTYDITVKGNLEDLNLGYIDTRPDKVITRTIVQTESAKGLYLGGTLGTNQVSAGVNLVRGKNAYGLSYNLLAPNRHQSVSFSFFRRVF